VRGVDVDPDPAAGDPDRGQLRVGRTVDPDPAQLGPVDRPAPQPQQRPVGGAANGAGGGSAGVAAAHPGITLTVEEISSTEIETALEEGRMDVGLGFLTRHSPNLRYEPLCTDEFALIVSEGHPWWNRSVIRFSELHQQRLLQLPDSFVMRRMSDEISRNHQVRPRTVAEINAIGTLLRLLGPLEAAALMPKIALRGTEGLKLKAIRLQGRNLALEIGLLRLIDSGANRVVGAFTELAQATVPKMIEK